MQDADLVSIQHMVVWSSFAVAFLLGALMNKTNFCTMGAVSDIQNMGDWNRMRMWLCAIAVAIIGTQMLAAIGWLDLSKSFYTQPPLTWLSNIIGGLMFGFGMVRQQDPGASGRGFAEGAGCFSCAGSVCLHDHARRVRSLAGRQH